MNNILGAIIISVSATAIGASVKAYVDVQKLKDNKIEIEKDIGEIKTDVRIIREDIKKVLQSI